MIAVIRIAGRVGLRKDIVETLDRLRLRKKYSCVVFDTLKGTSNPAKEQLGMVKKVKDFVAFGEIDDETYKELLKARGQKSKTFFLNPIHHIVFFTNFNIQIIYISKLTELNL